MYLAASPEPPLFLVFRMSHPPPLQVVISTFEVVGVCHTPCFLSGLPARFLTTGIPATALSVAASIVGSKEPSTDKTPFSILVFHGKSMAVNEVKSRIKRI